MPNTTQIIDHAASVARWEQIGLLDGLNPEGKIQTALYFDAAVKFMEECDYPNVEVMPMLMLPIIRRLLITHDELDMTTLLPDIADFITNRFPERVKYYERLKIDAPSLDPEAEAVADYCQDYKPPMFNRLKRLSI